MELKRKTENELDLPSGDEALDKSSDDSVFFVGGESNARKYARTYVRSSMSRPPGRPGMKIEQICLQTGKLLQRFDSVSEAAKLTGFNYSKIRASMGQVSDGFFWRVEGSTALPSHLEEPTHANVFVEGEYNARKCARSSMYRPPGRPGMKIEQICLQTGKLLQRFDSISEAAKLTGFNFFKHSKSRASMGQVSDGFFWRVEGSTALPSHLEEPTPATVTQKSPHAAHLVEISTHFTSSPSVVPTPSVGACAANVLQATIQKSPHAAHLVETSTHFTSSPNVVPTPSVGASAGKLSHLEEPTPANVLQATTQKSPHAAHLVETSTPFTSSPSVVPRPSVGASAGKPVEKYCVKTGRLLARFESIAEAALSVGVAPANIMAVVSSLKTSKMCMAFGWRHAASADPRPEASDGTVPAVPTNTVLAPSHVAGVASVGTYLPQQGDRFRVYFDKLSAV
jgi:hypothetical protein